MNEKIRNWKTILAISLFMSITLAYNVESVKAFKPMARFGVHDMTTYESRIGEKGLLIQDENIQMWVPKSYEEHSWTIFGYLAAGYEELSRMFGDLDYPYMFSIEHYPEGSRHAWGGTDAQGLIKYSYSNLKDNYPEWNDHGVPHMIGYYEEMAHCFVHYFMQTGFYETLGSMIGAEVTLRAANNQYIANFVSKNFEKYEATTNYYLEHNTGQPGVADNIWPTRVLTHIFKIEVIDVHGWEAFSSTFRHLREEGNPLIIVSTRHCWGGFLYYLGNEIDTNLNKVFADYGLPSLEWYEEDGYEKGMMWIKDNEYSFRVKFFDREGDNPKNMRLYIYSPSKDFYLLDYIGRDNETGWIYEVNINLNQDTLCEYAFSGEDGSHRVFQAIGPASVVYEVEVIPEFPSQFLMPTVMILTLISVILAMWRARVL